MNLTPISDQQPDYDTSRPFRAGLANFVLREGGKPFFRLECFLSSLETRDLRSLKGSIVMFTYLVLSFLICKAAL